MSRAGKGKGGGEAEAELAAAAGAKTAAQRQEMMHEHAAVTGVGVAPHHPHTATHSGYIAPPAPPPLHMWPGNVAARAHPPPPPPPPLMARDAVGEGARGAVRPRDWALRPPGGNIAPAPPSPMHEAARMAASKPADMRAALFNAVELELERIGGKGEGAARVVAPRATRKRVRPAAPAGSDADASGEEGDRDNGGQCKEEAPPPRARERHQHRPTVDTAAGAAQSASDTASSADGTPPAHPLPLDPVRRTPAVSVLAEATRRAECSIAAHREAVARGTQLVVGSLSLGPGETETEEEQSSRWQTDTALGAPACSQPQSRLRLRKRYEQRALGGWARLPAAPASANGAARGQTGGEAPAGTSEASGWARTGFDLLPRSVHRAYPHSAAATFACRYGATPGALHVAIARHVLHCRAGPALAQGGAGEATPASDSPVAPVPTPSEQAHRWEPLGETPAAKALRQDCGCDATPATGTPAAAASPCFAAAWSTGRSSASERVSLSGHDADASGGQAAAAAPQHQRPDGPAYAKQAGAAMKPAAGQAKVVAPAEAGPGPAWMRSPAPHVTAFGRDPYASHMMRYPMMRPPGQDAEVAMSRGPAQPFPSQGMWGAVPFYPMHQVYWPMMPQGRYPHM